MRKYISILLLTLFLVACDGEIPADLRTGEDARVPSVFLENGYAFSSDLPADVIQVDPASAEEVASIVGEFEEKNIDKIYFNLSKTDDTVTYLVLPRYAGLRFELSDDEDPAPVYSYRTKPAECIFVTVDRDEIKDSVLSVRDGETTTVLTLTEGEIATHEETEN